MANQASMDTAPDVSALIQHFVSSYDASAKDEVWRGLSERFKTFWRQRVLSDDPGPISDADCDTVIRILDRNGKGNTKDSEAVAKAMIAQGAYRRMFNEFHTTNRPLGALVDAVLTESDPTRKAALVDELYAKNANQRNHLTGQSGNAVCDFLAAYDPANNLSIISLKDRRAAIEFLKLPVPFSWDTASIGTRIVVTNQLIIDGVRALGLTGSARTISRFFYSQPVRALWKGKDTVKRLDKNVSVDIRVTVPTVSDDEDDTAPETDETVRESMQIQGLLAKIGTAMGFTIWLPKADRGRVLKAWKAQPGELLDELPLGYDPSTTKTIEQIDVLWLRKRFIVRAFEIEHTTSVYSGLLRMADLLALQPNINIKLHIVAPAEKREKVLREVQRPVFSLLEGRPLSEVCTYLSYDSVKEIGELKHLTRMSDDVIEDYGESADEL
jgi:hypothetical protein